MTPLVRRSLTGLLATVLVLATVVAVVAHDDHDDHDPGTELGEIVTDGVLPLDGPVTFDEYEAAMAAAVDCLNTRAPQAQATFGEPADGGLTITIVYRDLDTVDTAAIYDECWVEHAGPTELAWQRDNSRTWGDDLEAMVDAYGHCVTSLMAPGSDSADQLIEASTGLLDVADQDAAPAFEAFLATTRTVAESDHEAVLALDCLDEAGFLNFTVPGAG